MKAKYPSGIDGQFYSLLFDLPSNLPGIEFPERQNVPSRLPGVPDKRFFETWSERIFRELYRELGRIKRLLGNNIEPEVSEAVLRLWVPSYLLRKTLYTEAFLYTLSFYCGERLGAIERCFRKIDLRSAVLEGYREHVLHRFNVFLLGVLIYSHHHDVQKAYKAWLEATPTTSSGRGCNASYEPSPWADYLYKHIHFQFFEQWFNTACWHDLGYPFQLKEHKKWGKYTEELIQDFNAIMLEIRKDEPLMPSYTPIHWDSHARRLDVGSMNEIDYDDHTGEGHLNTDFWGEALKQIEAWSASDSLDHGINSAKLLLKTANEGVKINDVFYMCKKDKPWRRNSYRNYILPSLAIAKHNLICDGKLKGDQEISLSKSRGKDGDLCRSEDPENGVDMRIKEAAFARDFLTAMLITCDELQDFDRLGKPDVKPGFQRRVTIGMPNDSDRIVVKLEGI